MQIKKAIIPVAGMGTRFLPATKAQPKEMLPVVDKPVIQYIVEEAVAEVGFDTSPTSPVPAFSVVAGDDIQIVGCDNIAWCKVKNSAGIEGWFQVDFVAWATLMTDWSFAD